MEKRQTEVLVIGGGATGAGVLRDLAMRGFKTILVEKGDLTQGTTGRYHGLLHSGGRYVVKDPRAAVECIEENRILRRIMPHCIEDTGGFFVVTPWDDPQYAPRFMEGCQKAGIPVEDVPLAQMLREEPLLNPKISRCFRVPDASADSFQATDANSESAREFGANVLTYHRVTRLITAGDAPGGRIQGVICHDLVNDRDVAILADLVVNASGAWAGMVAATAGLNVPIVGGKGTMLGMNHRIVNTVINRCKMPSDGDILVPAHTVSVIGTTDVKIEDPDHISIEDWEVRLCLEEGEKMIPGFKEMRVLRAWAGVRPLYQESAVSDTRDVTRAFVLLDHENRDGVPGMITITSGKWTTYRKMAEVTVDLACKKLGTTRPCRTHLEVLPPPSDHAEHHYLGSRLHAIEQNASYGSLVCECELTTRADVERSILQKKARTIDDIRRDVRLGMGPCQGGFCTYRVAGILHELANPADTTAPLDVENTNAALRDFLQERWKGLQPILWGQQLRQERLDELIYLNLLNADHLPGPTKTPLGPEMYANPASMEATAPAARPHPSDRQAEASPKAYPPQLDVLVLGAGLAGLVTAWQASSHGKRVRVIAKGWGATHWASGCIDVLGYYPMDESHPLASPLQGLEQLIHDNPAHPYALTGIDNLQTALLAFQSLCEQAGYPMRGSLSKNWLLPTSLGTIRPTCLAPDTMTAGNLSDNTPMLLVGFRGYPDFYPHLIAANLNRQGYAAEGILVELTRLIQQKFITGRVLATQLEDPSFRAELAAKIKPKIANAARVGLPAVLGLNNDLVIKADLENKIGLPVFEIPTLPPSIPGMRLHRILLDAIDAGSGRVFEGMQVVDADTVGDEIMGVWTEAAARKKPHRARHYVLATGGILGGGIVTHFEGDVQEVVFDLPVGSPASRHDWYSPEFLAPQSHPIYRSGVSINHRMQVIGNSSQVLYRNLYAAGTTLASADTFRERSLEGVALASGFLVGSILGREK